MRLYGCCNARSYRFKEMLKALKSNRLTSFRESAHLRLEEGEVFIFDYGVTVFWGCEEADIQESLQRFKGFEAAPLENREEVELEYRYGERFGVEFDEVTLASDDVKEKLAISYAIAQSLKLEDFEEAVAVTIERTKMIPKYLAEKGRIPLDKNEIAKERGRLFITKSDINLHYDPLENPDFLWEYPEYEHFYLHMADYMDIKSRIDILNKKLEVIQELFDILADEQNHKHSSFLEWIIIVLIAVEIVFFLIHDVFGVF